MRLDLFLVKETSYPRGQIKKMISEGGVTIDGTAVSKPSHKVTGSEKIEYALPEPVLPILLEAQDLPLELLYEDDEIAVINKSAEMVVHPAAGHVKETLVNALLHRYGSLPKGSQDLNPGIVHRLDKGTSGCIVVARTNKALENLQNQFKKREVSKTYLAMVAGKIAPRGKYDKSIGRNPKNRQKMSSYTEKGKESLTEWKVLESLQERFSWVEIVLHTGRTHQIRVHFSEAGYPLIGDTIYGKRSKVAANLIQRPALHAWKLGFTHPTNGDWIIFKAPLPEDINQLLKKLRGQNIKH